MPKQKPKTKHNTTYTLHKLYNYRDSGVSPLLGKRVTCVCAWQERIGWLLTFCMYGSYHLSTTNGGYLENEVRKAIGERHNN